MNPGITWYLLLHLRGKILYLPVIPTDYELVCIGKYLQGRFHLEAQSVINRLAGSFISSSVPRRYWGKLLFNSW